jgi:type IV pilus assembly protein PilM
MDSASIGLDIGSSGVRAAEISLSGDGRSLRRYGQVGLPSGAVVDGEVVNGPVVSEALRKLWTEAGFSSNKVILGVSGHRVIVRQADVPALDDEDLRSALRFDAQELIPIPMEDASFDFTILDRGAPADEHGKKTMRILLVAAHRDLLRSHITALKDAGLEAVAIDAAPLSLMRVVPTRPMAEGARTDVETLVAIGADITTVVVRQGGVPRFIRSLAVGGSALTSEIANATHVDLPVAERLKREAGDSSSSQLVQARQVMTKDLRDLAEEVRATIDFFVAQSEGVVIDRLLITGGGSQTKGLIEALGDGMQVAIEEIDPFSALSLDQVGLDQDQLSRARSSATTAVGLALWQSEPVGSRLSVLPEEVAAARRTRRLMTVAAGGVAGLVGVLGLVSVAEAWALHDAKSQVHAAQARVGSLQGEASKLQALTAVHGQVQARQALVVTALTGDIDWVRVLGQLAAVMPPNLSLTSFSGARASATPGSTSTGTSTASTSSAGASSGVGTLTFAVTGKGGLPAVAAWLDGLQRDHALQGTWVSGVSVMSNGGTVTFSSTANLTPQADSNRAQAVKS